jgi:hypothetical protein
MAKKKEVSKQSNLSEEVVHDSSDEDEPQIAEVESESKSESESESTTPTSTSGDDSESSSTSGQDDSESESSASSAPSRKRHSESVPETPLKRAKKTKPSTVRIAPKPFKAPTGYESVTLSTSDYASDSASLFDDLTGKQIWHISVPDSVSIESIKTLDIQAALKGEKIHSKNGVDYNMQYISSTNETVLLPQGSNSTYKQAARIERSFRMQEMTTKPDVQDDDTTQAPLVFTATQTGNPKVIREQPQGLKMRFFPFGASPATQELEDVEMTDTFQVPEEVPEPSPKKKSKKSKHASQELTHGDSPHKTKDATGDASKEKKKKKKHKLVDEDVL